MSAVAQIIAASAEGEVVVGRITWRVRRVSSIELLEAGVPELLASTISPELMRAKVALTRAQSLPPARRAAAIKAAEDMIAGAAEAAFTAAMKNPALQRESVLRAEATIAAGVVAARVDDGAWDPTRVVLAQAEADPDNGRLWVRSLDERTRGALLARIQALQGEEATAEAVERFRRAAPGDAGPAGEGVPHDAGGGPAVGAVGASPRHPSPRGRAPRQGRGGPGTKD